MSTTGFSSPDRLSEHDGVPAAPARRIAAKTIAPARERELVLAAAAGDRAAIEELVNAFMPAIGGLARRYRSVVGVQHAELLQEGVVGLLRALRRFDPTVKAPFWAYASWWARQAMQQLVAEVAGPTVLSDRAQRTLARVREARREHLQAHGREPSPDELATASGISREQIGRILAAERAPRLLSESIEADDWTAGTLEERISDPVSQDAYDEIIEQLVTDQVRVLTHALDDRERLILNAHYGVGRPSRTLREIGSSLGISAERVRQIEEQALGKLRDAASSSGGGS